MKEMEELNKKISIRASIALLNVKSKLPDSLVVHVFPIVWSECEKKLHALQQLTPDVFALLHMLACESWWLSF